jgi:poly-gamma-glutamate capsule biosynthesis protein CapA/YwtB (metallophosphatase superfamily)
MANLESSWQASIIKLAQTGNSRAIAFWLNRDLVPQGICAQISAESSDCLAIQVVSRQAPDCDRLVRFICHRLCKLDSEAIQQVRITAQTVGSAAVLWEKSARIIPPSARQKPAKAFSGQPALSGLNTHAATAVQLVEAVETTESDLVASNLAASNLLASNLAASNLASRLAPELLEQLERQVASVEGIAQKTAKPTARPAQQAKSKQNQTEFKTRFKFLNLQLAPKMPKLALLSWLPFSSKTQAQPDGQIKLHSQQANSQANSQEQSNLKGASWGTVKTATLNFTEQSIQWFVDQKPTHRVLILGSSAAAAFLIGCGVELTGFYVNPSAFQYSKASLNGFLRNVIPSGSVQTASERIAIQRMPILNPDDPTVSLVFSNSDTLTRLPANQRTPSQINPDMPLVTGVEAYQKADMLITNLNHPIGSAPASQVKTQKSASPTTRSPSADDLDETQPKLDALPAETETDDSDSDADHEAEKMDFMDKETIEAESTKEADEAKKGQAMTPQELVANGVDLINWASNSVMPEGAAQLTQSFSLLRQGHISAIGAGETLPDARRPQIFDVKGQRIAYLGYSDSSPRAASGVSAGVNVSVRRQMQADIQAIRDQVNWVVVSFNWNRELRAYPEDWQIELAHAAIDDGADLIVGYHPTATQGAEIYNGRPIVYSLGDSIDEYSEQPTGNYEAVALQVMLKEHVMELSFLPLRVKRGQTELAQGKVATKIAQYLQQASSLFDQPMQSPTSLNSQIRLSLPAAPDAAMPTDPFINYPAPANLTQPNP